VKKGRGWRRLYRGDEDIAAMKTSPSTRISLIEA